MLAAREALAAEPGADAAAKVDVGRSLMAVAVLLVSTGKTDEALATYREAESLLASPAGLRPGGAGGVGGLPVEAGLPPAARARQTTRWPPTGWPGPTRRRWPRAPGPRTKPAATWRTRSTNRHLCRRRASRRRRRPNSAGVLAIRQKLADDNPAVTGFRSRLATSHINLGMLLSQTGKPSEAEAEFRKGLAIRQKLADDNPAVTEFRNAWRTATTTSAACCDTGKPSEAEAEFRKALAIQQKLADDNPAVTDFRSSLAISHHNLGMLLSTTGKPSEAEAEYRKAMAI